MPIALWVLLLASAIAFYILIGYPIFLAFAPTRMAPAVAKDASYKCSVSLIMAVYNGAPHLRAKMETILALDYPTELLQILVVSDGSTDESETLIREYSKVAHLFALPRGGKAVAVNRALAAATGDVLFFTDVRQPLDRMALRHLVANFADPTVGAVTGKLELLNSEAGEQADMDLYWRYELWARARHSEIYSLFNTTGCIYAMRRKLAKNLPPDTLSDDAALPLGAFFAGYRVVFDPAAIANDYPALAGTEARRRFRNLAGLWQIFVRFPALFSSRNRMRLHFLSHKLSRLVLPWVLLIIWGATWALPSSSWRSFLLSSELTLLVLAAVDNLIPKRLFLKRLTSPARTFVIMNAVSLAAPAVFFIPAGKLWVPTRVTSRDKD